jgi:hypothetical protein
MKNIIFAFIIVLFLSNCRPPIKECRGRKKHTYFMAINNSNKHVIFQTNLEPKMQPDTTIGINSPLNNNISSYNKGLKAGESYKFTVERDYCLEYLFENDKKEIVYIFDYDSLINLPWDSIRITEKGLLGRKIIDLDCLIKNKFEVTYP